MKDLVTRASNSVKVEAEIHYRQIGIRSHGKGLFHKEAVSGTELGNKRVFWVVENALTVNIVFAWEQAVAKTSESEKGMIASHRFPMYLARENRASVDFLLLSLLTPKGKTLLELASPGGAGRNKTLGQSEFDNIKLNIPSLHEQQKIAAFFTAIDGKLALLRRKVEALERYKRGAMAAVFSRRVRFRDEGGKEFGEWEEKKLGDVAIKVNEKNKNLSVQLVLTNSATKGIVNQSDYFDKEIAVQGNTAGYYIAKIDDFIYNPRISVTAPVGPIKRNKIGTGIMSPLYTVIRFKEGNLAFLEQYFETDLWHDYMKSIANFGARHDRMSVSIKDLFEMPIPSPCKEEQAKIASFLSAIDAKIAYTRAQVEQLTEWKRGLLQKMFV